MSLKKELLVSCFQDSMNAVTPEKCCDMLPEVVPVMFGVWLQCPKCGFQCEEGCIVDRNGDYNKQLLIKRWNAAIKKKGAA